MADRVAELLAVIDGGAPLAALPESLDLAGAYALQHRLSAARAARGERRVGRKIGFTNTTIWGEYGVHAPIWGPVWDTTLQAGAAALALGPMPEPRIEPEIVLCLARAPGPGMDAAALSACVKSVAPGFEIVQSPFAGWRFRAAEAVAAFALHGALVTGRWVPATPALLAALADVPARLSCDGVEVDRGRGANVLGGGPLAALAHLVAVLGADPGAAPLAPGEIITTGTLTRAVPVAPGQTWRFETGLGALAPLELRLTA